MNRTRLGALARQRRPGVKLDAFEPQRHMPQRFGHNAYTAGSRSHPDLWRWQPFPGSADSDLLPDLPTIRSRSRDLARNDGVAEGAVQTQTDNIVGTGLRLCATPDYKLLGRDKAWAEEWSNGVEALWRTWWGTRDCDAARSLTGDGLTTQVFRSAFLNGEALALPLWIDDPRPKAFRTRLQMIEPDRLSNPNFEPNTSVLRGGIEIDAYGAPVAYHIRKAHPGDSYMMAGFDLFVWDRIPAETDWGRLRVIHAHDRERTAQSRGKPSLASSMRKFKVLGDLTGAELKATLVNAMVAMVTESSMGEEALVELLSANTEALSQYQRGLSERKRSAINFPEGGGMVVPLALGEKFSSFSPARPSNNFEAFVTMLFRHIAAGLNMPYELLLKDFSKTNYSSARAALNEAWRFFKGRRAWLGTYWLQPVYELWLEDAISKELIDAPDFYDNRAAYARCRWIGPGRGYIDPLKEAQASRERIDSLTSTHEQECAEQGLDWEEVFEQRAAEQARMKELGLEMPAITSRIAGPGEVDPGAGGQGSDNPPDGGTQQNEPASAGSAY